MEKCDVLIIGTGVAGLTTAIKLVKESSEVQVIVVTRGSSPEESNTFWAQGGVVFPDKDDYSLEADIKAASNDTSNQIAIDFLLENGAKAFQEIFLDGAKVNFAKNELGELKFTQEAAHSKARILYDGDATGKEIEISLLNYLAKFSNARILTSHTAIDLITPTHHGKDIKSRYEENRVLGAYCLDQKNQHVKKIMAKKTVLATGGVGAIYLHHTNSEGARGDGLAMARRAGAQIINMGYIQFHPTAFYGPSSHRRFLISEAVRGEGGKLVGPNGQAFMQNYHMDAELAPRDIVSDAIVSEMIQNHWDCVYLDARFKDKAKLQKRFPNIYNHLATHNIFMEKDLIPVVPASHYTCGGIKVDVRGQTNLGNLYAVGEVSCSGLHGANRLASTSLLEGLVWGYSCAGDILKNLSNEQLYPVQSIRDWIPGSEELDDALIAQDKMIVKQTMWNYVGIKKSRNRILRAEAMFTELYAQVHTFYRHAKIDDELIGLRNSIESAFLVLNSSKRLMDNTLQ
jgi:L-aspartate oxidase